jgi:hypothetical protein
MGDGRTQDQRLHHAVGVGIDRPLEGEGGTDL